MHRSPAVSVLMPVRNAAHTVQGAVASIRAQTCSDWELIAIDDGSTDGTLERLHELASSDPRIRVLAVDPRGIVNALNAGLAAARGEVIARMDADDESHPERLAEQCAFLQRHADVGLVSCLVEFGGDRTTSEGYALHVEWINSVTTPEQIALNRFVESPFAHPSVIFRRELVERFGGYRAGGFPEDYELWLRWLDSGVRMAKLPRVLLRWNDPPARSSRTDPRYAVEAFFRVKAEWIAKHVAELARVWPQTRKVFVWGAGRPTRKRAAHLEQHGMRIASYIDIDAKKATPAIGGTGAPVIGPEELPAPSEIFVLGYVSSRGARELIRGELWRRGFVEGRDFLMCA